MSAGRHEGDAVAQVVALAEDAGRHRGAAGADVVAPVVALAEDAGRHPGAAGGDAVVQVVALADEPHAVHDTFVKLGALLRAVPRVPIALAVGGAFAAVASLSAVAGHDGALVALQASIVALSAAAVALLDEPALPALPVSRARRRALLLGCGLPPLALVWLVLLALAGVHDGEAAPLTLQLTTVAALSMGIGSVLVAGIAFCAVRALFAAPLLPGGAGVWAVAACAGLLALAARSRD